MCKHTPKSKCLYDCQHWHKRSFPLVQFILHLFLLSHAYAIKSIFAFHFNSKSDFTLLIGFFFSFSTLFIRLFLAFCVKVFSLVCTHTEIESYDNLKLILNTFFFLLNKIVLHFFLSLNLNGNKKRMN